MHIEEKYLKEVLKTIKADFPQARVFAFGSRVSGKNLKKYSDFDLAIDIGKRIPLDDYLSLKTKFSESDIPFRVDFSDFNALDENFKKQVEKEFVEIN